MIREQLSLFNSQKELFEVICSEYQLYAAFRLVKKNKGAGGVDGITIETFEKNLKEEIRTLSKELKEWKYHPQPVKRVEIPKPGTDEKRKLGIPCIRDRVLQQSIKLSLEPLFEPYFSESSFGFRPGKGQQKAIAQAQKIVKEGKDWIVDIDLEKFFDKINHEKVIHLVKRKVEDKRVIRLIGMTLRSGVLEGDKLIPSDEGSVQGSPLSPLLSNIVLDELDKELEQRGLSFCRFADDCNIFVGSQKAANRVMASISRFIEKRLKLKINEKKSKVAPSKEV
ncbi:group II intron reverse transcriptase/maturase, partial [Deltaproteobacteria bacterium TL4]